MTQSAQLVDLLFGKGTADSLGEELKGVDAVLAKGPQRGEMRAPDYDKLAAFTEGARDIPGSSLLAGGMLDLLEGIAWGEDQGFMDSFMAALDVPISAGAAKAGVHAVTDIPAAIAKRMAPSGQGFPEALERMIPPPGQLNVNFIPVAASKDSSDLRNLMKASSAERKGANFDEVYADTGLFRGFAGDWMKPINPAGSATLNLDALGPKGISDATLDMVLDYPALYRAMPELRFTQLNPKRTGPLSERTAADRAVTESGEIVHPKYDRVRSVDGSYDPVGWETIKLKEGPLDEMLSTLFHEIQHGIQRAAGLPFGTTPKAAGSFPRYWNNAGEAESRLSQTMFNSGDLATHPYRQLDVPPEAMWGADAYGREVAPGINLRAITDIFQAEKLAKDAGVDLSPDNLAKALEVIMRRSAASEGK